VGDLDTTTLRVEAILAEGFAEAYGLDTEDEEDDDDD
jgi:hypothetical protein